MERPGSYQVPNKCKLLSFYLHIVQNTLKTRFVFTKDTWLSLHIFFILWLPVLRFCISAYKLAYTTCLKTMFNSVYLLQDMNQNLLLISLLLKLTYRIGILEVEAFVLIPNNIRNSTIKERLREWDFYELIKFL